MMRKKSKIRSSREMLNNGLTRTKYGTNMGFEMQYAELKSGKVCAALRTVDATFGYAEITVFIARKYKKGSCQSSIRRAVASIVPFSNTKTPMWRSTGNT